MLNPEYIEVYKDYRVDVNTLVQEYNTISDKLEERKSSNSSVIIVHKLLRIYSHGRINDALNLMPYTMKVMQDLIKVADFNVVTYRCVMPCACYGWHKDGGEICLHIPLITNQGSRFVYEDKAFHMPADGSIYAINNSRFHSFMNAGSEPRLHITFENPTK